MAVGRRARRTCVFAAPEPRVEGGGPRRTGRGAPHSRTRAGFASTKRFEPFARASVRGTSARFDAPAVAGARASVPRDGDDGGPSARRARRAVRARDEPAAPPVVAGHATAARPRLESRASRHAQPLDLANHRPPPRRAKRQGARAVATTRRTSLGTDDATPVALASRRAHRPSTPLRLTP